MQRRGSAGALAYAFIGARLGFTYGAGTRLPIDEIATALGLSRQPVRDAVHRLANEGLVTVLPQVGCIVVRPTRVEIDDLTRLVAAADRAFLPIAAERATAIDLETIEAAVRLVERTATSGQATWDDGFPASDGVAEFFRAAYGVATSSIISGAIDEVRGRAVVLATILVADECRAVPIDAVRSSAARALERSARSLRRLFEALARGDADAVRRLADVRAPMLDALRSDAGDDRSGGAPVEPG